MKSLHALVLVLSVVVIAACTPQPEDKGMLVTLQADGHVRTFSVPEPMTVAEFLASPEVDVQWAQPDRINPPQFTQIYDGMKITIVRVTEQVNCEQQEIPYQQTRMLNQGVAPGEQRLVQPGTPGVQEICYRVTIEDGVAGQPVQTGPPTVITEPVEEIVQVGPTGQLDPVRVAGTLAYISNGNAWIIRNSSTSNRPLTTTGDLDSFVYSLSADGKQLIFTRKVSNSDDPTALNQLWYIPDTSASADPISLSTTNVLLASWVPGKPNTITYSNGEAREGSQFWHARNNLWELRIVPETGEIVGIDQIVPDNTGGLYGYWGTYYQWSPDGEKMAWVQADQMGLVDLQSGDLVPLLHYPVFRTSQSWSWRSIVSWSPDGDLLSTVVHGPPVGSEEPETSPAFNVVVTDLAGDFTAKIADSAGMWAAPRFSALTTNGDSPYPSGYIAYLRSRDPYNSVFGEYDLVIADRDGSNARVVFPSDQNQPGITTKTFGITTQDFVWSPDGKQLAFIYQGNLWIIDADSGVSHQLTLDGQASNPVWAQ